MRERRFVSKSEVRAAEGNPSISGYASVFNEVYDSGWFRETIKPGAFARALREDQDVRALLNHDANYVLGRTKAGTLTLKEDSKGLMFDCMLPDTQTGKDVRTLIQRGDISGCSFAFSVVKQSWREEREDPSDPNSRMVVYRDVEDLDLFDVSAVTYPAYEGTSIGARAMFPEGIPAEIRSHVPDLRDMADPVGNIMPPSGEAKRADDSDEDDMGECACRCEACSKCSERSAESSEESASSMKQQAEALLREQWEKTTGVSMDLARARTRNAEVAI